MGRLVRILSIGVLSFNVCAKRVGDQAFLGNNDHNYACPDRYESIGESTMKLMVILSDEMINSFRENELDMVTFCGNLCWDSREECEGFRLSRGPLPMCDFFEEDANGDIISTEETYPLLCLKTKKSKKIEEINEEKPLVPIEISDEKTEMKHQREFPGAPSMEVEEWKSRN